MIPRGGPGDQQEKRAVNSEPKELLPAALKSYQGPVAVRQEKLRK